jgi:hypothetical protein
VQCKNDRYGLIKNAFFTCVTFEELNTAVTTPELGCIGYSGMQLNGDYVCDDCQPGFYLEKTWEEGVFGI